MLIWLVNILHNVLRDACELNSALFIYVAFYSAGANSFEGDVVDQKIRRSAV